MAARLIASLAVAHLKGRRRASVVSIASVAVGVGFSIAMAALMEGSQVDFIERIVNTMPHIVMRDEYRAPPMQPVERAYAGGAVALRGQKPKDELRGIRNARTRLAEIDSLPGVSAAPILRGPVLMRYGGRDVAASLVGIDPARERRVSHIEDDLIDGRLDALYTAANGIILGDGLAEKLSARIGDTFTVSAPDGAPMKMTLVGVFHTGVVALDSAEAYALLKKAQVLQNRPNVINEIRMRVDDVRAARAVARRIEARLAYRTESWEEANENVMAVFEVRNLIMYTVVAAIMVVAAFGIYNIVSTITHEKARDIAILKSLGFPARDVRAVFAIEGFALGAAGSVCGWLIGYALYRVLGTIPLEVAFVTDMTRLPLHFSLLHYAIAAAFAVGSAALAGYLPARRAARLNPVAIIRGAA